MTVLSVKLIVTLVPTATGFADGRTVSAVRSTVGKERQYHCKHLLKTKLRLLKRNYYNVINHVSKLDPDSLGFECVCVCIQYTVYVFIDNTHTQDHTQ